MGRSAFGPRTGLLDVRGNETIYHKPGDVCIGGAVVALDARSPTSKPIALADRRSGLYAALSGFSYVRYEWFARLAQLWCGGTPAHSRARESIVVPATKIPDVGQHEFVVVDYVKLVVRVSPEIHPIQGARATSH